MLTDQQPLIPGRGLPRTPRQLRQSIREMDVVIRCSDLTVTDLGRAHHYLRLASHHWVMGRYVEVERNLTRVLAVVNGEL